MKSSARKKLEELKQEVNVLEEVAFTDQLTGLQRFTPFQRQLQSRLVDASETKDSVAVVVLDLDNFKTINDNYGHLIGDRLIESVASRLLKIINNPKQLGRWGGDEFVFYEPMSQPECDVPRLMERLLDHFDEPILLDQRSITISVSVGISLFPDNGTEPQTLLSQADEAMFWVKENQGKQWLRFADLPDHLPSSTNTSQAVTQA